MGYLNDVCGVGMMQHTMVIVQKQFRWCSWIDGYVYAVA